MIDKQKFADTNGCTEAPVSFKGYDAKGEEHELNMRFSDVWYHDPNISERQHQYCMDQVFKAAWRRKLVRVEAIGQNGQIVGIFND